MIKKDTIHIKEYIVFAIATIFISHISAEIFRYSRMPEYVTLIQGIVLFLFLLSILYWILNVSQLLKNHLFCRLMLLFTYISRGLIAIVNEHYRILPKFGDVAYYHHLGMDYSREFITQGSGIGASAFGNFLIGNFYFIFGNSPVIISLINSFLYSIIILMIIQLCRELKLFNYWIVALAAGILPSSFLYIPVMLRESVFLLLSILFFYRLVILSGKESRNYADHLIALILLLLTTLIRPQVFPILTLIYGILLIYSQRGLMKIVYVSIFLLSIVIISLFNLTLFQFIDSDLFNLYYFQMYRNAFSDLPNAYLVNIVYSDWVDFISYLPRFIIHFLFAPYPWVSSNYKFFVATIDSVVTIIIMCISLVVVIKNIRIWKKYIFPVGLSFLIIVVPFAMIEAYPMGAVRHRMLIILLMLPVFSCILPFKSIPFGMGNDEPK